MSSLRSSIRLGKCSVIANSCKKGWEEFHKLTEDLDLARIACRVFAGLYICCCNTLQVNFYAISPRCRGGLNGIGVDIGDLRQGRALRVVIQ